MNVYIMIKKNSGYNLVSGKYNGYNIRVIEIENFFRIFDFSEKRDKNKDYYEIIYIYNE